MTDIAALYTENQTYIRVYIYKSVRNWHTTEDLLQETFCRLLAAIQRGHGPKTNEFSYMWRTVRMVLVDHWRKAAREKWIDLDTVNAELAIDNTETYVRGAIELDQVELHMQNTFTTGQKQVVSMRAQGYKFNEIADAMNLSEAAVKALHHRAGVKLNAMVR